MRSVMFAALILLSTASIAGVARAGEPVIGSRPDPERNLRILLFSHHGPPAPEVFERAVPDARARIWAIANDPSANAALRDRALIALAGFGGDDVRGLYDRLLADRTVRAVARVHVLAAYTRAFPLHARVVLERAEKSNEPSIRAAAVQQLRVLADR